VSEDATTATPGTSGTPGTASGPGTPGTTPGAPTAQLDGVNLLVVATGSISVAFMPYWVNWLRIAEPGATTRIVLTPTARRFVSAEALSALLGAPVEDDTWDGAPEDGSGAQHVDLARWADAVLVHPCTFSYLARLATGSGDSPSMLALQSTAAPLVVCPALPPGTADGWAYPRHVAALEERGVTVVPPVVARSVTTGEHDAASPAAFPAAVAAVAAALRAGRSRQ